VHRYCCLGVRLIDGNPEEPDSGQVEREIMDPIMKREMKRLSVLIKIVIWTGALCLTGLMVALPSPYQ